MASPIIICTRFSVANRGMLSHFRAGRAIDEDGYIERLMNHERLKTRTDLFEISLRNLSVFAECSPDVPFLHYVLCSNHLPAPWREKLDAWEQQYSWLRLRWVGYDDDLSARTIQRQAIGELGDDWTGTFSWVRLDDDDILSLDGLQQIAEYNIDRFQGFALSFSRGYFAEWDSEARSFVRFARCDVPLLALGLTGIGRRDSRERFRVPDLGDHMQISRKTPVIVDGRSEAFIRTFHAHNDLLLELSPDEHRRHVKRKMTGGRNEPVKFDEVSDRFVLDPKSPRQSDTIRLKQELKRANSLVSGLEMELSATKRELEKTRSMQKAEIDALKSSTSWKVTKPLRWVGAILQANRRMP